MDTEDTCCSTDKPSQCCRDKSAHSCCDKLALVYGALLLRLWLAVRAIQTGIEKYAGTNLTDQPVKIDGTPNADGLTSATAVKEYALSHYHGVPGALMKKFEAEPIFMKLNFALSIYDWILGPMLLALGLLILLGGAVRTSLFLLGMVYVSLTWGLVLIKQDDGVSWLGVHMILIVMALWLSEYNRFCFPKLDNITSLMFSFKGRVNLAKFWGYMIPMYVIYACLLLLAVTPSRLESHILTLPLVISHILTLPAAIYTLVMFYPTLVVSIKRCHDRGRSGWFVLMQYAPSLLIPICFKMLYRSSGSSGLEQIFGIALAIIGVFFTTWYFIDIYLLPGKKGANEYGADPRDEAQTNTK